MKGSINQNDVIIIKRGLQNIEENEIIAINKGNTTIINRIYQIDKNNDIFFVKSDNNLYPDNNIFKKENIEGKILFKVPIIGLFIIFLQSKATTVIVIILLLIRLRFNILSKKRNIIFFKEKYK